MSKAAKISITVDGATLDEVKRLVGKDANLSAVFSEALKNHVHRLRMLALLDEMERELPMTPKGRAAGEKLWRAMQSSLTPVRSRRSPNVTKRSALRPVSYTHLTLPT